MKTTAEKPSLNEIYAPVQAELADFSIALKKELASDDALIQDIHNHLLKMTGKFLRPALTLFCAKAGDQRRTMDAVRLAVAIELIHTATLVHDDIIDDSDLRRNQPSIHSKWGREISIVSGDYLYAKAFLLLAGLKDVWVSEAFAACAHVMCEGEMKQIEKRNNFLMAEAEYLKIIHQKTAALFQAACAGGAYLSGVGPQGIQSLGVYGYKLGMAFQIIDDCLDLSGETEHLGKNTGLDIDKNDVTLPLLYIFQELAETEKTALIVKLREGGNGVFHHVQKLAVQTKALDRAQEKAREFADGAVRELENVKNSAIKESLAQLAAYCIERSR